jgi:two-component system, NarL family, invasion response regulator UvrY
MLRILIADDHEILRQGLEQLILEEYPKAEIGQAENGEVLLKRAMESEWDLVISDISMPVMNGLEALRKLRKYLPNLPVLILSMHTEDQYCINAINAGASGYLFKAMAEGELILAVRKILSGKKYIPVSLILKFGNISDKSDLENPHTSLSEREMRVFMLLAEGKSCTEIAEIISLSLSTISIYRSRILEKMHMKNNVEITRYAIVHNLL